jgi:hypothetical protein
MKKLENYTEIHSLIRKQKDNFPADYYSLDIVDKDDNIILHDKNKFASGPAAQGYFENHYLKKHDAAKTPKIKIESVYVEAKADDCADTSCMGEYTNKASEWAIDRASGEYVAKIWQREKIIEALHDKLDEHSDETDNPEYTVLLEKTRNRIKKIRNSGPVELGKINREYSFFVPYAGEEKPGTKEYKEYGLQDYNRMEALNNGQWSYIGIIAKAKILIPLKGNPGSAQYQTISSSGLWSIESDGGEDHLQETAREELQGLASQLEALGIGKRAIQYAIKQWDGKIIYQ